MKRLTQIDAAGIRSELRRILASGAFSKGKRSQRFLSYLVEAALSEPPRPVNEYAIALDVFDRSAEYDSNVDATVRVEAGRLRNRLREYYLEEGRSSRVLIEIPKGHYAAHFSRVEDVTADTAVVPTEAEAIAAPQPEHVGETSGSRFRSVPPGYAIACAACLVGLLAGAYGLHARRANATSTIHSMAVLPLRNLSTSPEQGYLAEGMTDELNTQLARTPNLRVISRDSVLREQPDRKPLQQIARELDVDTVVEGSVLRYGDKVRINAQLIDARHDRELWAASLNGDVNDLLTLQDTVAEEIASHARLTLSRGSRLDSAARMHPSLEAYDAYLRARYFLDKRDPTHSAEYFQRATDLDPNFAEAYAGLAESLEVALTLGVARPDEAKSRALEAAHKAIALDPQNGEAYSALGTIEFTQEWDWGRASVDLRKGIDLSPNDSFPVTMYGLYLDSRGDLEGAITQMRRAVHLDPVSFFVARNLGGALYFARRYDEALVQLQRAKELQPDRSELVDNWISWTYQMKGMQDESVRYDLASLHRRLSDSDTAALAHAYATGGWREYWRRRMNQTGGEAIRECAPLERAVDRLRMGERDGVVASLQQAFDQRCFWVEMIGADPRWDPIRSDPAFLALEARVKTGFGGEP